jgi:Spy/CpxP family protein refolding chaperone
MVDNRRNGSVISFFTHNSDIMIVINSASLDTNRIVSIIIITIIIVSGGAIFPYGWLTTDRNTDASSVAETHQGHSSAGGTLNNNTSVEQHSPYSDEEMLRVIKSLSLKDIAALQNGTGDAFGGLAILAELNGYPGPRHILDLSSQLSLTAAQEVKIGESYHTMNNEAKAIGTQIIAVEKEMNEAFSNKTITEEELRMLLEISADLYGQLRYIHLAAHLETVNVLTPEQIHLYNKLRGYYDDNNSTDNHQYEEAS